MVHDDVDVSTKKAMKHFYEHFKVISIRPRI